MTNEAFEDDSDYKPGKMVASGPGDPNSAPKVVSNNTDLPPSLGETLTVTDITSLLSTGQQPSSLSNQAYANALQTRNLSSQNAVANQQALNEVNISVLGKTVNKVGDLSPLEARSAVDVLTNDSVAQTIADLKAAVQAFDPSGSRPSPRHKLKPGELLRLIERIIAVFKEIQEANAALKGNGTFDDPYTSEKLIYIAAPITIGFKGVPYNKVKLTDGKRFVKAT